MLRREQKPLGYFPAESHLATQCVDAVEQRLFTVIRHGDRSASGFSQRLREDDPRIAFAGALVAVLVIVALILMREGSLP